MCFFSKPSSPKPPKPPPPPPAPPEPAVTSVEPGATASARRGAGSLMSTLRIPLNVG